MLKEIPNKPNHKIVGFTEHLIIRPTQIDSQTIVPIDSKTYEPIYERIFPLNTVYWDNSRNERMYLVSDTQGFDCEGHFVEIDTNQLEIPSKADQEMFFELLSHNGYEIKDGKLEFHPNYGSVYMTDMGIIVIYLADGCHACTNEIVNVQLTRLADTFETETFFTWLKSNGITYNPVTKCISESKRYYYFSSYSLYKGFQPEKKEWTNSDVDKFYAEHGEAFVCFNDCANFCNNLNRTLMRNYPKIKLEE